MFRCKLLSRGIGLKGNSPFILLFGSRDGVITVSRNDTDVFFMLKAGPKTTPTKRHCCCNHLTSFASDFLVPPNKIDWDKVSFEELLKNPLVFSVVCAIFGLYFLLVVWARRADRKDLEKVSCSSTWYHVKII